MRKDKSSNETATRLGARVFLPLVLCAAVLVPSVAAAADPADIVRLIEQMESSYARVNDYQAVFHKQERVGGKLLPEETILLKFQKPLKVYMKWVGEPLKGTEALYAQGKYDNKLIARGGGILGVVTLSLDPRGSTAMKGNRHPITEVGFGFIIEELRRNLDRALPRGECRIIRMGEEAVNGRPATVIEAGFNSREGRKYYASRMVMTIDKECLLPVGNMFYDDRDVLVEKYSYTDVKLNVGFTVMDFSRQNDKYGF
ncbi:MAG: DUF1571 domain-containing protein [Syntrophobacteraceae bacterium]